MKRKMIKDIFIAAVLFICICAAAIGGMLIWRGSIERKIDNIIVKAVEKSELAIQMGDYLKDKDFFRPDLVDELLNTKSRIYKTINDERYTVSADLLTDDCLSRVYAVVELYHPEIKNEASYLELVENLEKVKEDVCALRADYNNQGAAYNRFRLFLPEIYIFDCGCGQ
jgi:hypothetical protein